VFIAGGRLARAGLSTRCSPTEHLADGDLVHTLDFRQVYATVLNRFLGADAARILGRPFESLDFLS
jgi:uncharacterized protein (DUF1501 family)